MSHTAVSATEDDRTSSSASTATLSEAELRDMYSLCMSKMIMNKKFAKSYLKPAPYNLKWIRGYNQKVGVINLNENGSTLLFYAASNCGVIYNWTTHTETLLQGHRHMVTNIASDSSGKWLVTADSGPENIIIIWDRVNLFPQITLFNPHRNMHIDHVNISADAKYLLSSSYGDQLTVNWWIWSFGLDEPHATKEIDAPRNSVVDMGFNQFNSLQFALLTKHDIFVGEARNIYVIERGVTVKTNDFELFIIKPERKLLDIGSMTSFVFIDETSQILVATSRGGVVVYGFCLEYSKQVESSNLENLRYVKLLKLENFKINVIKFIDGLVVTGNSGGQIHFYDDHLMLKYWVHGFTVDSVAGLAFNINPRSYIILDPQCNIVCPCWENVYVSVDSVTGEMTQKLLKQKLPNDTTLDNKPFVVRDFVVLTQNQGVSFVDFVTEKLHEIHKYRDSIALSITVHPGEPVICVGYTDGLVKLVNFESHKLMYELNLREYFKVITPADENSIHGLEEVFIPSISVTSVKYSPSGIHLACGLNTGELVMLNPTTLKMLTPQPHKNSDFDHSIKEIIFSPDSQTLAFSDTGKTVSVYKYSCENLKWRFIGKYRAHYKRITSILFLPEKDPNGEFRLISLGLDRVMVVYEIGETLEISSIDRIEQTAFPLAAINWPTPEAMDSKTHHTHMPLILMCNDEYKYKIVNFETTMTLGTYLGPRFDYPVSQMQLITEVTKDKPLQYLLFATKSVIGVQKMPMDGNPWKHVGMLGHANQVTEMCFRQDKGILFTIGSKDNCVLQWKINTRAMLWWLSWLGGGMAKRWFERYLQNVWRFTVAVEKTEVQGGIDLDPYYCLIENGRPGWLFQEIRDLFYYIQILCQGTFSPAVRKVKDYIAVDSLPDMMRALGFFPSNFEVENLIVDAKYKVYQLEQTPEIDFDEFVKLYLNHRPAIGENYRKFKNAFQHFAEMEDGELVIIREELFDILANYGERFSEELTWYLLSILSGTSFEERSKEQEDKKELDYEFIPEVINLEELMSNILGVQTSDQLSQFSCTGSVPSQTSNSPNDQSDA